ncbi:MAG: class I SAM-dependent methyltransferase [Ignavibacteriaceae bacterium]
MKIRESGMPEEKYWETFFDVQNIFTRLKLDNQSNNIVEFGSGYGTFTIPAAKIIKGDIHAYDIDAKAISRLSQRTAEEKLSNIIIHKTDFVKVGTLLNDNSSDYVMLFNILHAEKPVELLKEAFRILEPGGKIGVIHWIYSSATPRGPSMDIRPKPEQCIAWMKAAGFKIISDIISLPPYHYGIVGEK